MQSFIALTLLKAEQTWVEDEKQTWKIFINIAQNKDNHQSVSNLYWQFIHNKTHFWLKMYYLFDKTCVQHWKSAKISNLKKKSDFGWICTTVSGLNISVRSSIRRLRTDGRTETHRHRIKVALFSVGNIQGEGRKFLGHFKRHFLQYPEVAPSNGMKSTQRIWQCSSFLFAENTPYSM